MVQSNPIESMIHNHLEMIGAALAGTYAIVTSVMPIFYNVVEASLVTVIATTVGFITTMLLKKIFKRFIKENTNNETDNTGA
jgi:hypothetical protein